MSHLKNGVSYDLKEEYFSAMQHDNIDISSLMVHSHQVEYASVKRKCRVA